MSRQHPILVTGASGFLGRHVLTALQAQGIACSALVRDPEQFLAMPWTDALRPNPLWVGELANPNSWLAYGEPGTPDLGFGGIIHLAAQVHHSRRNTEGMFATNVDGTLSMLRLAAEQGVRMVFVSTSGVVGCFDEPGDWADEQSDYRQDVVETWPYYHSKYLAELEARKLAAQLGVELVVIRPPVLLGPGDHRVRSTGHIAKAINRRLPFVVDGGIHFIDVRDAAEAVVRALLIDAPKDTYHLTGEACSVTEFFDMVAQVSGVPAPRSVLPVGLARLVSRVAHHVARVVPKARLPDPVVVEMASKYWGLRSRYAQRDLSFVNRRPLQTLADTVAWLRANDLAPT